MLDNVFSLDLGSDLVSHNDAFHEHKKCQVYLVLMQMDVALLLDLHPH